MLRRHVYLLGFMACGKTTVGRVLAQHLGCPFHDLDALIEQRHGSTIASIMAKHGEEAFRRLEADELRQVAQLPAGVVATGGGTPCFGSNMQFMKHQGITVYIELPAAELVERLSSQMGHRPLLMGIMPAMLLPFVEQLLAQRHPIYTQAHHRLKAIGLSPEQVAEEIGELLTIKV